MANNETEIYQPPQKTYDAAFVKSLDMYRKEYIESISDNAKFWERKAPWFPIRFVLKLLLSAFRMK